MPNVSAEHKVISYACRRSDRGDRYLYSIHECRDTKVSCLADSCA